MSDIILFDMDGTLTLPRENIKRNMITALKEASKTFDIGIVTGSDYDYVMEQCDSLFSLSGVDPNKLFVYPCNGTKEYIWRYTRYEQTHNADMIAELGLNSYKKILTKLFDFQSEILLFYPDTPLTGTFFHYRGSMLNWCPIGRIANQDQRAEWKKLDKDYSIRREYMKLLIDHLSRNNISATVTLGGSTSFDIYPNGWDKTYVMNHLDKYKNVYFIGDKCQEGGNDKTLYDLLTKTNNAYETKCPDETIKIISKLLV
jgi:phosphomannomutase